MSFDISNWDDKLNVWDIQFSIAGKNYLPSVTPFCRIKSSYMFKPVRFRCNIPEQDYPPGELLKVNLWHEDNPNIRYSGVVSIPE